MKVPISVTKENIRVGLANCRKEHAGIARICPLALSMRAAGVYDPCCGIFNVSGQFEGKRFMAFLPIKARKFIDQFHAVLSNKADNNLKPFCFNIWIK